MTTERRPWWSPTIGWAGTKERKEFSTYQERGGGLGFNAWIREGKPAPPTQLTATAQRILEKAGIPLPPEVRVAPPTPGERVSIAQREARDIDLVAPTPPPAGVEVPPFPEDPPPPGFRWAFDRDLNRWIPQFTGAAPPPAISPFQEEQQQLQRERFEFEQQQVQQQREITPFQQQQFDVQQQQFGQQQTQFQAQLQFQQQQAQQQAELQRQQEMARLAANPINWLQFASFTGADPLTQQWMVPLGMQQAQVGQPIPGFEGQEGQQIQTFANLPELTTPSRQLQARWGPTAQAQFLGFERARTGAAPQETQFRLGSGRAPTGRFRGFTGFR